MPFFSSWHLALAPTKEFLSSCPATDRTVHLPVEKEGHGCDAADTGVQAEEIPGRRKSLL